MPIRLDSAAGIPQETRERLVQWNPFIQDCEYLDDLLEQEQLGSIARDLNGFCLEGKIVGIHYTRAIREEIESYGLRSTSGDAQRTAFVAQYGHLFTGAQIVRIRKIWESYFDNRQTRAREKCIWFNFTFDALKNRCADPLLEHFGGEQIYMPLAADIELGPILRTLGEPLIITCTLDPKLLTTFSEYPWGKIWLSSYHARLNQNAHRFDLDAYHEHPVLPDNIVIIDPMEIGEPSTAG